MVEKIKKMKEIWRMVFVMAVIVVIEGVEVVQADLVEEDEVEEEDLVLEHLLIEMIRHPLHQLIVLIDQLIHGQVMKNNNKLLKNQKWVNSFIYFDQFFELFKIIISYIKNM